MSTLERAIEIAEKAHAGQYDKGRTLLKKRESILIPNVHES